MHIGELFSNVITAILSGFLAFSGFFSSELSLIAGIEEKSANEHSGEVILDENTALESEERDRFESLPSQYEYGGPIPDILLRNPDYQQASVAGARRETPESFENLPVSEQITLSIVNIFCTYREEDKVRATTGSGVFIDPRGVVLTNAHIAQFLLLEGEGNEHRTRCVLRQGDPAEPKYVADLLYIPPLWVRENAELIDAERPAGTGERDYALLYVSESANDEELPEFFPALTPDTSFFEEDDRNAEVLAAGYPAEIILSEGPRADLSPKVASTTITELYTFNSGEADLISIASSEVGEQGSSGGPVVSEDGRVIGLIVTRGDAEDGAMSLRALTLPYINTTIFEETGFTLAQSLTGDLAFRSQVFKSALVPFLSYLLEFELD